MLSWLWHEEVAARADWLRVGEKRVRKRGHALAPLAEKEACPEIVAICDCFDLASSHVARWYTNNFPSIRHGTSHGAELLANPEAGSKACARLKCQESASSGIARISRLRAILVATGHRSRDSF